MHITVKSSNILKGDKRVITLEKKISNLYILHMK